MMSFIRSTFIPAMAIFASLAAHAQTPASAPPPSAAQQTAEIKLEELPAKLAEIDQELKQHLATFLAIIDAEAKAKRLSETYAQSLRWSGQTAVENSATADARALVSTARLPLDNPAAAEARAVLDAAIGALGTRRSALLTAATRAVRKEIAEAVRGTPALADVKALGKRLEIFRDIPRNRSGGSSNDSMNFMYAEAAVAWLLQIMEAEASRDPNRLRTAVQQYPQAGDLIADADRRARIGRALQPLATQVDAVQKVFHETVESAKPAEDRQAALIKLEDAVQQLSVAASGQSLPDSEAAVSSLAAYRAMAKGLSAMEAGDASGATNAFQEARNASQRGRAAAWLIPQLTKWETEVAEAAAKNVEERRTKLRARLTAVTTPAELEAVVEELATRQRVSRSRGGSGEEENSQLAQQLALLATAWSTTSLALLQQDRYGNAQPGMPFAKEVAAVRKIAERELLVKTLRAPELNQSPLAELPVEAALEKLGSDLAQRGEWRRLYQLVQARAAVAGSDPRTTQHDLLGALQLFFAGQNLELAEQWADAVQAYKGVLRSTSEHAPIAAAAERVKVLTKDHPEANVPASGSLPARSFP